MCKRHWYMVSQIIRAAVWKHYREGQCDDMNPSAAYCRAAKVAVEEVARREGKVPDTRLYDLIIARHERQEPTK